MEEDLKMLNMEYHSNHFFGPYSNLKLKLLNHILQILKIKTTSNGRQHQTIKSGISQQPLIGSFPNLILKLI